MIYNKQPKKVKGARKKARAEDIERLQTKFPIWFEGKTEKEIIRLVSAFRNTGMSDDEFPSYCISYEAMVERIQNNKNMVNGGNLL